MYVQDPVPQLGREATAVHPHSCTVQGSAPCSCNPCQIQDTRHAIKSTGCEVVQHTQRTLALQSLGSPPSALQCAGDTNHGSHNRRRNGASCRQQNQRVQRLVSSSRGCKVAPEGGGQGGATHEPLRRLRPHTDGRGARSWVRLEQVAVTRRQQRPWGSIPLCSCPGRDTALGRKQAEGYGRMDRISC